MANYAVTGSAGGMGAAVAARLRSEGHLVIGVDVRDADIVADLSNAEGRARAIAGVATRSGGALTGLITAAGVGPQLADKTAIPSINFFGTTVLVDGLRLALEAAKGSVVLVSSNSATQSEYDGTYIDLLLAGDEAAARAYAASADPMTLYGGSKLALLRWMRRQCNDLARKGVRINAICPGFTYTGMTEACLTDSTFRDETVKVLATIPLGRGSQPAEQASAIAFLLGGEASYVCGSVLFVDGGYDALVRADRV